MSWFLCPLTELWITIHEDLFELCSATCFKLKVFSSAMISWPLSTWCFDELIGNTKTQKIREWQWIIIYRLKRVIGEFRFGEWNCGLLTFESVDTLKYITYLDLISCSFLEIFSTVIRKNSETRSQKWQKSQKPTFQSF